MDIIEDQYMRIKKYGDIVSQKDIARKTGAIDKEQGNQDFYDLDDPFLCDDEIDVGLQSLAICEAKLEDFVVFKGVNKSVVGNICYKGFLWNNLGTQNGAIR